MSWGVKLAGYGGKRGSAVIPESGTTEVRVELERNEGDGDFELSWPGGEPVAGAYVLAYEPGGARRPRCVGSSNLRGGVALRRGCLEGSRLVVLHPEGRLGLVDGDQIASTRRFTLEPAPRPPPRLRVVGEDGRPIPGIPVWLEVASPSGRGEGPWSIGPSGAVPLRVLVGTGRERREAALTGWRSGEEIEVVLER